MQKIFDTSTQDGLYLAKQRFDNLIENKKIIELDLHATKRTNSQSKARWLYLTMISDILNEQGQTLTVPGLNFEVKFTKDNLYEIYWQSARFSMYPNKKGQLSTKEFSDLVDVVQMMFAQVFDISISFPDWKNLID